MEAKKCSEEEEREKGGEGVEVGREELEEEEMIEERWFTLNSRHKIAEDEKPTQNSLQGKKCLQIFSGENACKSHVNL